HMDHSIRARLRLHLLSERAMGLDAIAASNPPVEADAEPREAEPLEAHPVAGEAPRLPVKSPAQAQPPANLFGVGDESAAMRAEGLMPPPLAPGFDAPVLSTEEKRRRLVAMDSKEVHGCTKCRLCETRTHTVFG